MFNKQIKVGEEVVLECLCDGFPKPQIKWLKDNIPLKKTSRHYFTPENQLLVITDTNTDDSGIYKCEISNSVGKKFQEVEVLIMPCNYYFILICFKILIKFIHFKHLFNILSI